MEISLREFQRAASDYLDKTPLTLTRYGKPILKVVSVDTKTEKSVNTSKSVDKKDEKTVDTSNSVDTNVSTSDEAVDTFDGNVVTSEAGFGNDDFIEQSEGEDWGVCESDRCDNPANTKISLIDGKVLKVCGRCANRAEQEDALDKVLEEKD